MEAQNARLLAGIISTLLATSLAEGSTSMGIVIILWPVMYVIIMVVLFAYTEIRSVLDSKKEKSWKI